MDRPAFPPSPPPRPKRTAEGRLSPLGVALLSAVVLACAAAPAADTGASARPAEAAWTPGLGEAVDGDVERIRAATETFASLDAAVAAGYSRDGGRCLDNPPHGAMGYHHQKASLMDDRVELERPEILVYERLPGGDYRFNGVEYIVPFSAWPADASEPPTVMGQDLKRAPGLGIWYLHVWVWRENPSGLFADWNPRVSC